MSNIRLPESKSLPANIQITLSNQSLSFQPSDGDVIVKYVNGLKQGEGEVISKSGIRIASLTYKDDKLHGPCIIYNDDGSIRMEAVFENGVHNGWGQEYRNHEPIYSGIYKNGSRFSKLVDMDGKEEKKEIRDGQILSICKYDEYHQRHELCYEFENGKVSTCLQYNHGTVVRKHKEFIRDERVIEYDEKQKIIYLGDYLDSFENGYCRHGKGYECVDSTPQYYCEYINGKKERVLIEFRGDIMKEFDCNSQLVYEGGFSGNMEMGYVRNNKGTVYENGSPRQIAIFENGSETLILQSFIDNELTLYDNGRILYRGEYNKNKDGFIPSGMGANYHYDNGVLTSIIHTVNGEEAALWMTFNGSTMQEFDENGSLVYEGEGSGESYRHGKGSEFIDGTVVYSGDWKESRRCGEGTYYQNHVIVYSGEWKDNLPNGFGRKFDKRGVVVYSGMWKKGYSKDTSGVWKYYADDNEYALDSSLNVIYKGNFNNGVPHGKGHYLRDGQVLYEGIWQMGDLEIDRNVYVNYLIGIPEVRNQNNQVIYRGDWENGHPSGNGTVYYNNKMVYQGKWDEGKLVITDTSFLDIENGTVFVNERQTSLFCFCFGKTKIIRNPLVIQEKTVPREKKIPVIQQPYVIKDTKLAEKQPPKPVYEKPKHMHPKRELPVQNVKTQPPKPKSTVPEFEIPAPLPFVPSYTEPW